MDTYEKKYKNALTIAQSRFKIEKDESVLTCLGMMFPELRESEDERIRKAIIELLKEVEEDETYTGRQHIPDMLSYLEKQKEKKPAEWSEEDENTIELMIAILRENHPNGLFKTNPVNTTCMSAISTDMLIKRIESLRPSWKPSEEQMEALENSTALTEEQGAALYSLVQDLRKL